MEKDRARRPLFELDDVPPAAKIKVIGLGGGGGNAVSRMMAAEFTGVEFIVGSHLWGRRFVPRKFVDQSSYVDDASDFETGKIARTRRRRIQSAALHHVRPIHAGGGNANQHLAPPGHRIRPLDELQHFGWAWSGNLYAVHVNPQLPIPNSQGVPNKLLGSWKLGIGG